MVAQMNMMVDIETAGGPPNGAILSVGWCVFRDGDDPATVHGTEFKVDIEDSVRAGMAMDARTVRWWMEQDPEAQKVWDQEGSLPLRGVLGRLFDVYALNHCTRVWAYPPSFDVTILEAAYRACGMEAPWHYRSIRCCRTAVDVLGYSIKGAKLPERLETRHHAGVDAARQAFWILDARRKK